MTHAIWHPRTIKSDFSAFSLNFSTAFFKKKHVSLEF